MDKKKLNDLLNQKVQGKSMEQYIAGMLAEAEKTEVNVEKLKLQNSVLKQWNMHHGHTNASFRIELREKEAEIETHKLAVKALGILNKRKEK